MPDLLGGHRGRSAEALAAGAGGGQALVSALDDELADELRERGQDVEHQPPAWRGGVERFLQGPEPDAALRRSATMAMRSWRDRPSRSSDGTTRVSPGRR